jgi:hypothetical protein
MLHKVGYIYLGVEGKEIVKIIPIKLCFLQNYFSV